MSTLAKGLRYLVGSPDYFLYYFLGKLSSVLTATTSAPSSRLDQLREELAAAPEFVPRIRAATRDVAGEDFQLNQDHHFLYALVRLTKPKVIVETGVFDGFFSACFLQALAVNEQEDKIASRLISIDLPARDAILDSTSRHQGRTTLPPGHDPGWVIPAPLRSRWQPHFGDSRELLPKILAEVPSMGLFFHDSLHTYDHMMFEYETAWPKLEPGGLLLSHDVHWNRAFPRFARRHRRKPHAAHGFGLIRKE